MEDQIINKYFSSQFEAPNVKPNDVCYAFMNTQESVIGHINLIVRFTQRSSRRNEHVLVDYQFEVKTFARRHKIDSERSSVKKSKTGCIVLKK